MMRSSILQMGWVVPSLILLRIFDHGLATKCFIDLHVNDTVQLCEL